MVKFMDVYDFRLQHAEQTTSWDVIARFVNTMHNRSVIVGWMHTARGWQLSAEATNNPILLSAILDVALNFLYCEGCLGGTLAHGIHRLPELSTGALGSITIYWNASDITDYHYLYNDDAQAVNVHALTTDWRNTFLVQFAFYDTGTIATARTEEPTVPQL